MGLKIWLPLNGNTDNIGLSDQINFTNYSSASMSWSDAGKIGKALSLNGGCKKAPLNFDLGNAVSASCWVYYTARPATNDWMFSFGTASGTANTALGLLTYNTYMVMCIGGIYTTYTITIETGKWYHFCITWDGSVATLYKDGEPVLTTTELNNGTKTSTTYFCLGGNCSSTPTTGTRMKGMLNDVRVYDNCLSAKDVKELYKCMIVHFPLDNIGSLGSRLSAVKYNNRISNGDFSAGTSGWTTFYNCNWSVSNGVLTVSKASSSGVGGTVRSTAATFVTSHLYYIKTVARVIGTGSGRGVFTGFASSSNTVNSNSQIQVYSENWTEASVVTSPTTSNARLIIRSGTSDSPAGTAAQCKFYMCVDLTNAFGSGNEPTKEECDAIFAGYGWKYKEYSADYSVDMTSALTDCSGFENHASFKTGSSLTQTATLVSDTPRNEFSTKFSGTNILSALSPTSEARSASFWMKFPETVPSTVALFMDYKSKLAFGFGANGVVCSCRTSSSTVTTKQFPKTMFTAGNWYHVVVVNDGTTADSTTRKLYVNGSEIAATTTNNYWTWDTDALEFGGRSSNLTGYPPINGYVSDFRMYAAPLSADQVKELYNTSAWIDNLGDVSAIMLREGKSWPTRTVNAYNESPQVEASGILRTENLIESSPYLMVNNGSVFLKILDHNNPASNLFTVNNCWLNNSGNLYSCLDILRNGDIFKGAEEFEFYSTEKLTSSSTETSVRWTQTSNPATTSSATGFSLVSGTASKLTAGLANAETNGCFDISGDTWWCCCGAYNQYSGGIPGFNGVVTTGYLRLWVKLPDEAVKGSADDIAKFFKRSVYARHFYEV